MEIYTFCRIPHRRQAIASLLLIVVILAAGKLGQCQDNYNDYEDDDGDDDDGGGNTADVPFIATIAYDRLMSLTGAFTKEFGNQLKFCIKDSDKDWNQAFNFSSDLRFLVNCNKKEGCFKKSSCKPNSSNQDITIFGALVMVAICLLILIIYNFFGQILSKRERRQAKSREAATRSAREIAQAREKWKLARDIGKELKAKQSKTLLRKLSKGSRQSHGSSDASSSENVGLPPKKKESSSLTKVIQAPFGAAAAV